MNYYALLISISIFGCIYFGLLLIKQFIEAIMWYLDKAEEFPKYTGIIALLFALFYSIYQYLIWSQL